MSLLTALFEGRERSTRNRLESMQEAADETLSDRLGSARLSIESAGVTGAAVVNGGPDGEPVVVPIARISLPESRGTLDRDAAWSIVPETLRVLHEAFDDVFVRHYDVQFAYDGDGLFEAREVDRIAVTPETIARLIDDAAALREYVEREDEIAPVAWREAVDYGTSSDAVVVTTAAAGACGAAGG